MRTVGRIAIALLLAGGVVTLGWRFSAVEPAAEPTVPEPAAREEAAPEVLEPIVAATAKEPPRAPILPVEVETGPLEPVPLEEGFASSTATLVVTAVREDTGAPLAGIEILVGVDHRDLHGPEGWIGLGPAPTDRSGLVAFEVPAGEYLGIVITKTDRTDPDADPKLYLGSGWIRSDVTPLRAGDRHEIRMEVPIDREISFWGRVVDERGVPLAGAEIRKLKKRDGQLDPTSPPRRGPLLAESADDGLFELRVRSLPRNCLTAFAPSGAALHFQATEGYETLQKARIIRLPSDARLSVVFEGNVAVGADWKVRFSTVLPTQDEDCYPERFHRSAPVDTRGCCELGRLPAEQVIHLELLDSSDEPRRSTTIPELVPGEQRVLRWSIDEGARIRGLLLDQFDEPVRGHPVLLRYEGPLDQPPASRRRVMGEYGEAHETITDEDGRFELADVREGFWWLGPRADWMAEPDSPPPGASEAQLRALLEELYAAQLSAVAELVEVTGEEGELEVELRAHRGLFIEGRLLDRDDELVDGDYIVAIHEDSELIFDAEAYFGTFRLGPLLPGVYVLHARTYHGPLGDPVRASAGEKDLVIRVPHRVFVGGRLIDAVTREGLDGEVWFTPNADPYSAVESDAHRGIFHAGMAEGTYDVVGVSKDGKYGLRRGVSLTSDSEAESLIIEAHPGAELLVELVTSDVLGFTIHLDGALVAWRLDSKAHCTVPPGELVVRGWRFDEVIEERTVTLTVGEKKEVRFE